MVIPEEQSAADFEETEDDEMDYEGEIVEDDDDEEDNGPLDDWLKEWCKREQLSDKIKRIANR